MGATKFVTESILLPATPEVVWQIVSNPFEFQEKLCPWMHTTEVLTDEQNLSRVKVTVEYGVLPRFSYHCEFKYTYNTRIDFRSVGGALKNFEGYWILTPASNGNETLARFSMYLEPGIPVPQWIMRQAEKVVLHEVLSRLRERVEAICCAKEELLPRSILAARSGI